MNIDENILQSAQCDLADVIDARNIVILITRLDNNSKLEEQAMFGLWIVEAELWLKLAVTSKQ